MAVLSPYWKVSQGVYCLFEYSPKKKTHCDYFLISITFQPKINVVQNLLLNL